MSKLRFVVAAVLPLALVLLSWIGMRTVVTAGSESLSLYGFPLAWVAPSGAASMAFDIAAGPLLVDLAIYLAFAAALVALAGVARASAPRARATSFVLWVVAAGSIAWCVLPLLMDPHFVAWTLDGYFGAGAARTRALQLGPPTGH